MANEVRKGRTLVPGDSQTGGSNIYIDRRLKALAPGKRESADGSIYYEYRRNRSDLGDDEYVPLTKAPAKKTVVKKTAVKKAPVKKTTVKKAPVKKSPVNKTAVKKTAVKKTAVKKTAVKKTAVKKTAVKKAPVKKAPQTKDPFAFLISTSAIIGPDLEAEAYEAYKQKQEDKADRYMDLAHKKRKEAKSIWETSYSMVKGIPGGQPIISESDRNLRDRSWNMVGKSIKVGETADYYENKAMNTLNPKGISSDDPTAITQLKIKIEKAKQKQENMKAVNKIAKSKRKDYTTEDKINDIIGLGYSKDDAMGYMKDDYAGRAGCPSYLLTNNNANIRRMEQRVSELQSQRSDVTKKIMIGGVKVVDDVQDNRLRVFFDDKPDEKVISQLKSYGFRWSPSAGAWQSYRGDKYMYRIKKILQ